MFWMDVLSRILHVATAVLLLGGSLFNLLVLQPVLKTLSEEARGGLVTTARQRWKPWVHAGIAIFLASGFYNYFRALPSHKGDGLYHAIIGTKIVLALGLFFVSSVLVGSNPAFEKWRKNLTGPLTIVCLLGLMILAMSGFIKVYGAASH